MHRQRIVSGLSKSIIALLLGITLWHSSLAQTPNWEWVQKAEAATGSSQGLAVVHDAVGHFNVVGHFRAAARFGSFSLTSSGQDDLFLVQYNSQGQVQWAQQAGGPSDDNGTAVAADALGNLYVTGSFQGRALFGTTALTSVGGNSLFIAKYATDGTLLWVRQVGGGAAATGKAIAIDRTGNIYAAGTYQGSFMLASNTLNSPSQAGMVVKYDPQGQFQWVQNLPDSDIMGITTDGLGNAYIVGALTTTGSLVAKYDATGTLVWMSESTGTAAGTGYGVATDQHGDVYVTGSFRGTLTVAPSSPVVSQGLYDGFLAKFNAHGTGMWVRSMGGSGDDAGHAVAVSPAGLIGVTGQFQGPALFGTVLAGNTTSSCGCPMAFVAGYGPQGNCQWVRPAISDRTSVGMGLAFNAANEACVTGAFEGRALFDNLPALASSVPTAFTACLTATYPDLVVSTAQPVQGSYHDLTITNTGDATLTGALYITGTLTVVSGGRLITTCQPLTGPGAFVLSVGAELRICHADGIATMGNTGAVQVTGSRQFSPDAAYTYTGTVLQQTGHGLPAQVRSLTVANGAGVILSQAVSIAQNLTLSVGDLRVGNSALTLLSSPAGMAQVDNAGGVVQGTVTVQRYLDPSLNPGYGYRHLSSPVQATTVADLTTTTFTPVTNLAYNTSMTPLTVQPFPTVVGYDETRLSTTTNNLPNFDKGYFSPASNAAPLEVLRGYSVQLAGNQTLDFVGELNSGTYQTMLTRGPQADAGWNLIGNPYPSTLDWSQVTVPAGLDNAVYVYQSSGPYTGQYRSYVNGVGNPLIALGQGFLVRPNTSNSAVLLTLTNAARSADFSTAPTLNRQIATSQPLLQLSLSHATTGIGDETTIYFDAGATQLAEIPFDAYKAPTDSTVTTSLCTTTPSGDKLAINGLPMPTVVGSVALWAQVPQLGNYVLTVTQYVHLTCVACFLHDAQTGRSIRLGPQSTYTFQTKSAGSLRNRFSLHLEPVKPSSAVH